jgi:AsmA protein
MYEIAKKFRYALRWLAFAAAVSAIAAGAFASALPFLIEDRAVHDGLIRSLTAWSGGPVTVQGPLRVASFTSLSIEANGVKFASTPRLSPIGKIEAKSVTAILRVRSLLWGRIEFKKVVVESPRVVFNRREPKSKLPFSGLETAGATVAFADLSRFKRLELHDCTFFTADGGRRAYSRVEVQRIRLDKEQAKASSQTQAKLQSRNTSLFTLLIRDHGFEAYFHGNLSRAEETARGVLRLKASAEHPASEKITGAIAPWERGHGVSLAGDLIWTGARASLDRATIAFGDHEAKGSMALAVRSGRALLEGTLAYDRLAWMYGGQESGGENGKLLEPLRALILAHSGRDSSLDLDMRISAERFQAGSYEAGPLALALTSRPNGFNIDIAELQLFGGKITGRLDYDPAHPEALNLNARGTRLDSHTLTGELGWPSSVSGPVTVRLALDIPLQNLPQNRDASAVTGSFAINFPAGGTLDGEMSRRVSEAFAREELFEGVSSSSFPFSAASIDGAAGPGGIALKIDAESAGSRIGGSLRIASPGNTVSGTLSVKPDGEAEESRASLSEAPPNSANIVLSGTVAALNFAPSRKPSLSN